MKWIQYSLITLYILIPTTFWYDFKSWALEYDLVDEHLIFIFLLKFILGFCLGLAFWRYKND